MARKKSRKTASLRMPTVEETSVSISPSTSSLSSSIVGLERGMQAGEPPASSSSSKSSVKSSAGSSDAPPPILISRNNHWKFLTCFQGAWLQMPLDVLDTMAHINYNTILPQPIDPGCLFDVIKVRRLFEEATALAVRAASDSASPMLTSINAGSGDMDPMGSLFMGMAMGLGMGNGMGNGPGVSHGARLSKERRFRMREQACRKLARAYRLDEIACSVATTQGALTLEDIGKLVLQRNPGDADARYVEFFHEKIPSLKVAEFTSLQPLTDILSARPGEPEVLRTRALAKAFKRDYDGAIQDLTHALSMHRFANPSHEADIPPSKQSASPREGHSKVRHRRRPNDVMLSEEKQPSSFEGQILFQRATIFFTVACEYIRHGVPIPSSSSPPQAQKASQNVPGDANPTQDSSVSAENLEKQAHYCRMVKQFAKRALKDYVAFLSQIHYSPDYPIKSIQDYTDRVASLTHSARPPKDLSHHVTDPYAVYPISELFANPAKPPSLPPFPPPDLDLEPPETPQSSPPPAPTSCEWLTFHPLVNDALHSILLCHLLLQTPPKDLKHHVYMVARLARLADGFPTFQAAKSASRTDWIDILRLGGLNWLDLPDTWENLTAPLLIPFFCTEAEQQKVIAYTNARNAAAAAAPEPLPALPYQPRLPSLNYSSSPSRPRYGPASATSTTPKPTRARDTNKTKTTPHESNGPRPPPPTTTPTSSANRAPAPSPTAAVKQHPQAPPKGHPPRPSTSRDPPRRSKSKSAPPDDDTMDKPAPPSQSALLILHWHKKAPPVAIAAPSKRKKRAPRKSPRGDGEHPARDGDENKAADGKDSSACTEKTNGRGKGTAKGGGQGSLDDFAAGLAKGMSKLDV